MHRECLRSFHVGKKQHYIPQFLLRRFGSPGNGKSIQVTAYSRERGIFTTATDGIGAERHFYSTLSSDGAKALDEEITAYETPLSSLFEKFWGTAPGEYLNTSDVAEAVTHLCIRQPTFRKAWSLASQNLLTGASEIFLDEGRSRKALGLEEENPTGLIWERLDETYSKFEEQFQALSIDRSVFVQGAFIWAKANYRQLFEQGVRVAREALETVADQSHSIAREAHNKALSESLAPELRVEFLKQFAWRLEERPPNSLILPDCIAIGRSNNTDASPLIFFSGKTVETVLMPLHHDLLLIGNREGEMPSPLNINELFAACSWDGFFATERSQEFEKLVPMIGHDPRNSINDAVKKAFDKNGW